MHLSRCTYVPLFLQTVKNIYFSPTSPLLVLSTPEKHYKFFGFTRRFDLNMNTHIKTTRRKRLRVPSRTNLTRCSLTIYDFPPYLAANKPHNNSIKKIISIDRCIHRKNKFIIHSYENLTMTTRPVPLPRDVAGPKKHRLTKYPDLFSQLLLPLLLLLLLIMECVRPCRSTCCHTDETPSFLILLQTAHDYPTPVSCHR